MKLCSNDILLNIMLLFPTINLGLGYSYFHPDYNSNPLPSLNLCLSLTLTSLLFTGVWKFRCKSEIKFMILYEMINIIYALPTFLSLKKRKKENRAKNKHLLQQLHMPTHIHSF